MICAVVSNGVSSGVHRAYPSTQAEPQLCIVQLGFATLALQILGPESNARIALRHGLDILVSSLRADIDTSKSGLHLFAPPVIKIAEVIKGSQCLREIHQGQAGVEDAANEAEDERRRQRIGLLGHGVDVAHELGSEVHRGSLGIGPAHLPRCGRDGRVAGGRRGARKLLRQGLGAGCTIEGVHCAEGDLIAAGVL